MNNLLTESYGQNKAINDLQEELYESLIDVWGGDIEGYGKVYKNLENSVDDKPKYYQTSKIFTPEAYNSETKDYEEVFYNDAKSCVFCFLTSDKDSTNDGVLYESKVKVVFMTNLEEIYPYSSERVDSKAHKEVVQILRQINGDYNITGIERGVDTIFREYTTDNIRFDDMQPLHMFAITLDLNYYLTDKCT